MSGQAQAHVVFAEVGEAKLFASSVTSIRADLPALVAMQSSVCRVFHHLRRLPIAAVIPLHDFSVRSDHGAAEGVSDQTTFRLVREREVVCDLWQVCRARRDEFPAFE